MLVLTRKAGEAIVIGPKDTINLNPSIRMEILSVSGGNVQLGFQVDPEIKILRGELLQRKPLRRDITKGAPKSGTIGGEGGARPPAQPKVYYKKKRNNQHGAE